MRKKSCQVLKQRFVAVNCDCTGSNYLTSLNVVGTVSTMNTITEQNEAMHDLVERLAETSPIMTAFCLNLFLFVSSCNSNAEVSYTYGSNSHNFDHKIDCMALSQHLFADF